MYNSVLLYHLYICNHIGDTALHRACHESRADIVRLLLDEHANPSMVYDHPSMGVCVYLMCVCMFAWLCARVCVCIYLMRVCVFAW